MSRARLFGGLRQRAHFVGDDGESLAVLTGARRLDCGVQRQEVGLVGDARHGLDHFADCGGLLVELRHHLDGGFLTLRRLADSENGVGNLADDFGDLRLQRLGLRGGGFGVFFCFVDQIRAAIDRFQRLLRSAGGLFGAGADLFDCFAQFFGGRRGFRYAARQLARRRRYSFGRLLLAGKCFRFPLLRFGQELAAAYRNFIVIFNSTIELDGCHWGNCGRRNAVSFCQCHGEAPLARVAISYVYAAGG